MSKVIYADNSATTAPSKKVIDAMTNCYEQHFGNPSSMYSIGRDAKEVLDHARSVTAKCLGAAPDEIYFTSGGSESDNWAIKGVCRELKLKGKNHIITSAFEHHAVLHTIESLVKYEGFEVTYLDVHKNGIVRVDELKKAIRPETALVTIMYANNEIGTIQPITEIGKICKEHNVLFHTDAVQAIGNVHINVHEQNIDMLSLSAHKFHGPKGVGALYVRKGIRIRNLIEGGAQEKNKRAGTENVPGIVGLAVAIEDASKGIDERTVRLTKLRNKLIDGALKIDKSILNGDREKRLPGNFNMCFKGIEGESLLLMLDAKGICASSGSACTSGSLDPSHVLLAIGLPHEIAHGSLRISLGDENTEEDINYILEVLPQIVNKLRAMSPLWDKIIAEDK